ILNAGTLVISDSELKGGLAHNGGAVASESTGNVVASLSIGPSTLDGNVASGDGGAVANLGGGMSIVNSTISGNSAIHGGAIVVTSPQQGVAVMLLNDTLAGNQANNIGGILAPTQGQPNSGTITLKNTLVAGNQDSANPDVQGTFISQGHNLLGNAGVAGGFNAASGDQLGGPGQAAIDPKLGPLQNNGGPTSTMLPAADSSAVDAGDNNGAPSADQRGILRPLGGTVDIGAVEAAFLTVTRFDDGNLPGQLRRAIRDANSLGGSHVISLPAGVYHLTVQGVNENGNLTGDLNVLSNITLLGAGADQTIIDASALGDRAFHILTNAMLTLSGVTIEGGAATDFGGAVLNEGGTVIISHSELKNNSAHLGGAIENRGPQTGTGTLASATNGIDAATSTLVVANASQFPATLPFTIQIDQEQLAVTDVAGDTLFVARGANGTTAAPHDFGSTVSVIGSSTSSVLTAINSTIAMSSLSSFPSTPGFLIQIDSELMQVVA